MPCKGIFSLAIVITVVLCYLAALAQEKKRAWQPTSMLERFFEATPRSLILKFCHQMERKFGNQSLSGSWPELILPLGFIKKRQQGHFPPFTTDQIAPDGLVFSKIVPSASSTITPYLHFMLKSLDTALHYQYSQYIFQSIKFSTDVQLISLFGQRGCLLP